MDNWGSWMNDVLSGWGVSPTLANVLDEMGIALLLIRVAVCVNYVCQGLLVRILFSRVKIWKEYERIQSDIFDHLLWSIH